MGAGQPVKVPRGAVDASNESRLANLLGSLLVVLVLLATVGVWIVGVVALVLLVVR